MFETFDIYTAGYCLMRGHMPKCVPAPGNRYKFVFAETARAIAAEVGKAVSKWRDEAARHGLAKSEIDRMASAFEHEDLEMARGAKAVNIRTGKR